jgi:hypothetical protein
MHALNSLISCTEAQIEKLHRLVRNGEVAVRKLMSDYILPIAPFLLDVKLRSIDGVKMGVAPKRKLNEMACTYESVLPSAAAQTDMPSLCR